MLCDLLCDRAGNGRSVCERRVCLQGHCASTCACDVHQVFSCCKKQLHALRSFVVPLTAVTQVANWGLPCPCRCSVLRVLYAFIVWRSSSHSAAATEEQRAAAGEAHRCTPSGWLCGRVLSCYVCVYVRVLLLTTSTCLVGSIKPKNCRQ